MRFTIWAAALLLLAATGSASAADAEGNTQLALLQERSIFHSGLRDTHTIALTFDDGPNLHTPDVLDALKRLKIKATFFIVGKMAHRYPDILARIAAEGHLLGNHSASHPLLGARYDAHPELLLAQLRDVDEQISPLMKKTDIRYFRAPYGAWRKAHAAILNADPVLRNYVGPIYWDIGGDITFSHDGYILSAADWSCWHHHWSAETCAKGYLREIRRRNGGVVLMHCIHSQSGALVEAVVPALVEEGYRFVRLDQVPEYKQYETPAGNAMADAAPATARELARLTEVK